MAVALIGTTLRAIIQGLLESGGFLFGVVLRDSSVGFALKGDGGLILVDFDDADHVHFGRSRYYIYTGVPWNAMDPGRSPEL